MFGEVPTEFVAAYAFDVGGTPLPARLDDLGVRSELDEDGARALLDEAGSRAWGALSSPRRGARPHLHLSLPIAASETLAPEGPRDSRDSELW